MSELIEIVFQNVMVHKLVAIISEQICPQVLSASYNGEDIQNRFEKNVFEESLAGMKNGDSIFLNTRMIASNSTEVQFCSAQIIKYNNILDLSLIFDLEDLPKSSEASIPHLLRDFAFNIAQKYSIDVYYGGIEPACDKQTQLFAGTELGPLKF